MHIRAKASTVITILTATGSGGGTAGRAAAPGDAQWTALTQWTVATLVSATRPDSTWYAGGWRALPLDLSALGLKPDWQRAALAAVGDYGQICERHLGSQSALQLAPGLNRHWVNGGVLLAPFIE